VGWAGKPALEKLINKGARCELVSELLISLLFLCALCGLCVLIIHIIEESLSINL